MNFNASKCITRQHRLKASLYANAEMLTLSANWENDYRAAESGKWGRQYRSTGIDFRKEFLSMQGLSLRNLKYMRQFASAYADWAFVQAARAQITWYRHHGELQVFV